MEDRKECPLCEQGVPASLLQKHIESEQKGIRHYLIEQIRGAHPGWVEENGACPKCWEYYRKL